MNSFTIVFLIALTLSFSVQFWLAKRHAGYVAKHRSAVPDAFKNTVSLEAHQKAADYTLEKSKLGIIKIPDDPLATNHYGYVTNDGPAGTTGSRYILRAQLEDPSSQHLRN